MQEIKIIKINGESSRNNLNESSIDNPLSGIENSPQKETFEVSTKQITFVRMFANCVKFYGRGPNMFLSNDALLGRPFKVLNTWAQLQLMCMIVTVLNYATDKELHKDKEIEDTI